MPSQTHLSISDFVKASTQTAPQHPSTLIKKVICGHVQTNKKERERERERRRKKKQMKKMYVDSIQMNYLIL